MGKIVDKIVIKGIAIKNKSQIAVNKGNEDMKNMAEIANKKGIEYNKMQKTGEKEENRDSRNIRYSRYFEIYCVGVVYRYFLTLPHKLGLLEIVEFRIK